MCHLRPALDLPHGLVRRIDKALKCFSRLHHALLGECAHFARNGKLFEWIFGHNPLPLPRTDCPDAIILAARS